MTDSLPAFLILLPLYLGIPTVILYFIIKIAVKEAMKELKDDNVL